MTLNANGTFTYIPYGGYATSDTFTYCANGTVTAGVCSSGITATVTLGASALAGNPTAITQSFTARTSTYLKIPPPGLLLGNTDPNNLPLTVVRLHVELAEVIIDQNGGFSAAVTSGTASTTFNYTVQNSQGRTATGTATVTFPAPSNLTVKVVDAKAYKPAQGSSTCISGLAAITDYRWIIEEDKTFYVDPNCTTNTSITTPGCPGIVAASGVSTIPTFAVNFHTSHEEYVAQGCTGPLSCESGPDRSQSGHGRACAGGLRRGLWRLRYHKDAMDSRASQQCRSRSQKALLHLGLTGRRGQPVQHGECGEWLHADGDNHLPERRARHERRSHPRPLQHLRNYRLPLDDAVCDRSR